ncbi:MAG TPA: Uma2 family endonuclease [Thermoanaerobaculia bacterium]|nr:Uma2 family endonuclease [Thermoanaerobaculia bacterium]
MPNNDYLFPQKVLAVQGAISRARTVFLISNLATIIVIGANFNLYLTWMKYTIVRARDGGATDLLHILEEAKVRDLRMISIPILGSNFYAADIGIISSLTMIVLSVWLYYSFRREQHSVGRLILDISDQAVPGEARLKIRGNRLADAEYALFALSTAFVFVTTEEDKAFGDTRQKSGKAPLIIRWTKAALFYAPCWSVLLCAVADASSLSFPSTISSSTIPISLWGQMGSHPEQRTEALIRIGITVLSAAFIFKMLSRANYYHDWTQKMYQGLSKAGSEMQGLEEGPLEEPEQQRALLNKATVELITGGFVANKTAGCLSGRAAGLIYRSLSKYEQESGKGYAFPDNVGFLADPQQRSFSPNAAFWTGELPEDGSFLRGAPVFAVEVRTERDYGDEAEWIIGSKQQDYFTAGTQIVWDVDVLGRQEIIKAYRADQPNNPIVFKRGDRANAEPALPGWSMLVDDLLAPGPQSKGTS